MFPESKSIGAKCTIRVEQINTGISGEMTVDGIIDLVYSLKGPYRRNASFLMPRLIIRDMPDCAANEHAASARARA